MSVEKQKNQIWFKAIAVILIQAFLCLDFAWAANGNLQGLGGKGQGSSEQATLAPAVKINAAEFQEAFAARCDLNAKGKNSGSDKPVLSTKSSLPGYQAVVLRIAKLAVRALWKEAAKLLINAKDYVLQYRIVRKSLKILSLSFSVPARLILASSVYMGDEDGFGAEKPKALRQLKFLRDALYNYTSDSELADEFYKVFLGLIEVVGEDAQPLVGEAELDLVFEFLILGQRYDQETAWDFLRNSRDYVSRHKTKQSLNSQLAQDVNVIRDTVLLKIENLFDEAAQFIKDGNFDRAIEIYKQALVIAPEPDKAAIYNQLGVAYFMQRDFATSRNYLEKALQIDPHSFDACTNLALVCCLMGDYRRAYTAMQAAENKGMAITDRTLDASEKIKILNQGFEYLLRDELDAAERCFSGMAGSDEQGLLAMASKYLHIVHTKQQGQDVLEDRPDRELAMAYNYLGLAHLEDGRIDKAIVEFMNACSVDESFNDARQNLSRADKLEIDAGSKEQSREWQKHTFAQNLQKTGLSPDFIDYIISELSKHDQEVSASAEQIILAGLNADMPAARKYLIPELLKHAALLKDKRVSDIILVAAENNPAEASNLLAVLAMAMANNLFKDYLRDRTDVALRVLHAGAGTNPATTAGYLIQALGKYQSLLDSETIAGFIIAAAETDPLGTANSLPIIDSALEHYPNLRTHPNAAKIFKAGAEISPEDIAKYIFPALGNNIVLLDNEQAVYLTTVATAVSIRETGWYFMPALAANLSLLSDSDVCRVLYAGAMISPLDTADRVIPALAKSRSLESRELREIVSSEWYRDALVHLVFEKPALESAVNSIAGEEAAPFIMREISKWIQEAISTGQITFTDIVGSQEKRRKLAEQIIVRLTQGERWFRDGFEPASGGVNYFIEGCKQPFIANKVQQVAENRFILYGFFAGTDKWHYVEIEKTGNEQYCLVTGSDINSAVFGKVGSAGLPEVKPLSAEKDAAVKRLVSEAIGYMAYKRYRNAIGKLKEALEITTEDANIFYLMARSYSQLRNYGKAIFYYKKVLEINPDSPSALVGLAGVYCVIGDYTEAYELEQKALALGAKRKVIEEGADIIEKAKQGFDCLVEGRFKQAIDIFREFMDTTEDDAVIMAGKYLEIAILMDEAQASGVTFGAQEPTFDESLAKAYNYLGQAHLRNNNLKQAIDMFEHALSITPLFDQAEENLTETKTRLEKQNREQQEAIIPDSAYAGISITKSGFYLSVKTCDKQDTQFISTRGSNLEESVLKALDGYARQHNAKIISTVLSNGNPEQMQKLGARLFQELDIKYRVRQVEGKTFEQIAQNAALISAEGFHKEEGLDIENVWIDDNQEVHARQLATLDDYRKTATDEEWDEAMALREACRGKKVAFFNTTPEGGGVAIMRKPLIPLLQALGIDAHWYVLKPDEETDIFSITKNLMHLVLQGIRHEDLSPEDKEAFRRWSEQNAQFFTPVIKDADIIIIDDYQPSAMIPYIKAMNPKAKIIYRSHIQLRKDLIDDTTTPQYRTWEFLYENGIKDADIFVSHPIKEFVPANVAQDTLEFMPATTDPLDGLNKELTDEHMAYYLKLFNEYLKSNGQPPLDLNRRYIIQIARYDSCKGIPDVLAAYKILREKLQNQGVSDAEIPQLVIVGNAATDDPEGTILYEDTLKSLQTEYKDIAPDIKVARPPHLDQMLNALLRKSHIALQLSHAEGYEVKVSEALAKGKPVIAYRTGGIPLQIEDKVNGFLVDAGNIEQVAEYMKDLLTDEGLYSTMSENARTLVHRDVWTISNAIEWFKRFVEVSRENAELSDEVNGKLKHLLVFVESEKYKDFKYVDMIRIRSILEQTESYVKVTIVYYGNIGDSELEKIREALRLLKEEYGERVERISVDKPISAWAHDSVHVLDNAMLVRNHIGDEQLRPSVKQVPANVQAIFNSPYWQGAGFNVVYPEDIGLKNFPYLPNPGDFVIGDRHVFVGPKILMAQLAHFGNMTEEELRAAGVSEQDLTDIMDFLYTGKIQGYVKGVTDQITKNLFAIIGTREVIFVTSAGDMPLTDDLDLYFSYLGENKIVVADVGLAGDLWDELEGQGFNFKSTRNHLKERLDAVARSLEEQGFEIIRVPYLPNATDNTNATFPMHTYNNILVERFGAIKRIYMPVFGTKDLDAQAIRIYEAAGFEVLPIQGYEYLSPKLGALRCSTKVLKRDAVGENMEAAEFSPVIRDENSAECEALSTEQKAKYKRLIRDLMSADDADIVLARILEEEEKDNIGEKEWVQLSQLPLSIMMRRMLANRQITALPVYKKIFFSPAPVLGAQQAQTQLLSTIKEKLKGRNRIIVRIGGKRGTGKSTFSAQLNKALETMGITSAIVNSGSLSTADDIQAHIDVLGALDPKVRTAEVLILEGVYSNYGAYGYLAEEPECFPSDINVYLEINEMERLSRLAARDAEESYELFLDGLYTEVFDRYTADLERETADLIVDTTAVEISALPDLVVEDINSEIKMLKLVEQAI